MGAVHPQAWAITILTYGGAWVTMTAAQELPLQIKEVVEMTPHLQTDQHFQQQYFIPTYWIEQLKIAEKNHTINRYSKFNSNTCIMKNYKFFPFEELKRYEETFVENNSALIEE